jgi:hypothetical protein
MSYPIQAAVPVRNGKRVYTQAPVRRETRSEYIQRQLSRAKDNAAVLKQLNK